jgi:hypothetical protein
MALPPHLRINSASHAAHAAHARKAPLGQHAEFEDLEAWDKAATLEPTTDE